MIAAIIRFARSGFGFREIFDVWEVFEVVVLGPEGGFVDQSGGVDDGICEREFVFDEQIGREDGDCLVGGDDDAAAHGVGDGFRLGGAALFEGDFSDFREDDGGDDQIGEFA